MNFLDESGLKKLWAKIKASFNTAIVNDSDYRNELDNEGNISIPFVANHQIISNDISGNINVFNWFKGASEGGILEIVSTGSLGGRLYGIDDMNTSIMYKMKVVSPSPPMLDKCDRLTLSYNTYARLIKLKGKLIVAEFV